MGATQFQSAVFHGYINYGSRSISLLSSNHFTTDSLFSGSYSGLIHPSIEALFSLNSYRKHLCL